MHRGEEPPFYFWRTVAGAEVDLVVEAQNVMIPLEIKLSETPRPEMARGLVSFQQDFKEKTKPGYLIHPGKIVLPLGHEILSLPLMNL
jgi:predicted AAA+ superfamily ATPase